jgi:hypothetical protein
MSSMHETELLLLILDLNHYSGRHQSSERIFSDFLPSICEFTDAYHLWFPDNSFEFILTASDIELDVLKSIEIVLNSQVSSSSKGISQAISVALCGEILIWSSFTPSFY